MHPYDIREKRFRFEKAIAALGDDGDTQPLQDQIAALIEICPHEHFDEDPTKGWRCRDCGMTRDPEPVEEPEVAAEEPIPAAD